MQIERSYTEYAQYGLAQVRVHGEVFDNPIKKGGEHPIHSRVQITLIDDQGRDVPIDILYAAAQLTDSELKSFVHQTTVNVKDFFPPSAK